MLFLNYQANKNSNGSISIKLINQIVANGRIKEKPNYSPTNDDDWECFQLNSDKKILQHIFIENPFSQNFEYLNDNKELEIKKIDFDSVQVSIRFQLHKNTKFVTLQSSKKNKSEKPTKITTTIERP